MSLKSESLKAPFRESLRKPLNICTFALGAFAMYTSTFGVFTAVYQRGIVLGVAMIACCLQLIAKRKASKFTWKDAVDIILLLATLFCTLYIILTYRDYQAKGGVADGVDIVIATIVVVVLCIITLKVIEPSIVIITLLFIAYALWGTFLPPPWGHRGYSLERMMPFLSLGTEGVYGTVMGSAASIIIIFALFGTFMEGSGCGKWFLDVAFGLVGRSKGGSAKAAIVASGLMGMVSGSSVANILTTGNFTLPLMIKTGYKKMTAAAILAVAATGGLIMPPVMGAAAFVMAEIRGWSYSSIAIMGIIPAVLYYVSLFMEASLEADKVGMRPIPKEKLPSLKKALKQMHLAIPIVVLIGGLIAFQAPPEPTAMLAIALMIGLSYTTKATRLKPKAILRCMANGGEAVLSTIVICGISGVMVGVIGLTGFGIKISAVIMAIGGQSIFMALVLAMIVALVLGLALPPVAAYIIMAAMVVPSMVEVGVNPFAADMFAFYFSCLGAITPPVAVSAFTSASMVGVDPSKTGWLGSAYAIVAFIVPYAFCVSPSLLMKGDFLTIVYDTTTAIVGVAGIAITITGWFKGPINIFSRILTFGGAVLMVLPGALSDGIGVVVLIAAILISRVVDKKKRQEWAERMAHMPDPAQEDVVIHDVNDLVDTHSIES